MPITLVLYHNQLCRFANQKLEKKPQNYPLISLFKEVIRIIEDVFVKETTPILTNEKVHIPTIRSILSIHHNAFKQNHHRYDVQARITRRTAT